MKTRFVFLALFVFFVFALPLRAQDNSVQTPTPGGLIYGLDAEVLFPEAVRFTIALTATANELTLATLTLRISGQSPVVIPVSIAESATLRDPFTEIVYVWDIPRESPPPLFSNVVYEWQITRTNNQVVTVENQFEFTDSRLAWTHNSASGSSIRFSVPAENFNIPVLSLRNNMQGAYDLMRTNTAVQPSFHIMVYPVTLTPTCSRNNAGDSVAIGMLSGDEIPCNDAQAEAVYRVSNIDTFQLASVDSETQLLISFADLFTQRFYAPSWNTSDVPLWFQRGIAVFYLPTNKLNMLEPAQRAARGNNLFTLDDMNAEPSQDAALWRAQSYGMVLYMARQIGVPGLFALARNPGASFAEAYQNAMGQPLSNLINSWQRWLFTSAAEDAYGYYPQLETTATPTFTPTATLPRPTATPTVTNTPTATATLTATGIPAQVLPTLTVTRQATDAPPSVTPRPAGSVRTATPTPTPTASSADQSRIFSVLAIVFMALAAIAAVFLWQGRRR
jgi:hypothetical protein